MTVRLTTPRLQLRDVCREDLEFLCEIYTTTAGVPDFGFVYSRDEVVAMVDRAIELAEQPGPTTGLWVAERRSDGVPIGRYGVMRQTVQPWPRGDSFSLTELGWYTHPEHRRQGFALEAADACRQYAHDALGVAVLGACVLPRNLASAAVAERLGMQRLRRVRHADLEHDLFGEGPLGPLSGESVE